MSAVIHGVVNHGPGGGGHSNNVVHMHDQRNTKRGLFFCPKHDLYKFGVKMCLFLIKRVFLESIKVHLEVIFQTPPNMSSKKSLLRVNLSAKSCKVLIYGCFS